MSDKSFEDILKMIKSACMNTFYRGIEGLNEEVLRCATQIYIAQMNTRTQKEG